MPSTSPELIPVYTITQPSTSGHAALTFCRLLTHTAVYTPPSDKYRENWDSSEQNTSPKCQTPSKVSMCPHNLSHNDKVQSGQDPVEDDKRTGELP